MQLKIIRLVRYTFSWKLWCTSFHSKTHKSLLWVNIYVHVLGGLFCCRSNDVLFRTEIDQEWEVLDFIAPNFTKISIDSCEPFHNGPRGVLPAMKQGIMKQLVPLMGSLPNGNMRSSFWETLPTNKKSKAAAPIPKEEQ